MSRLSFIAQYIAEPRTVGAIMPSSEYLAEKMVGEINFENIQCIVEYGPGTGIFTEKLIKKRNKHTVILLVEYNTRFYDLLVKKYKNEENLYIINDSAEHIDRYLKQYNIAQVDYVISGLPFASLPEHVSSCILSKTKQYLKKDGKFITFQYTLLRKRFISRYFREISIKREYRNIPPAYVFSCGHQPGISIH